MLASRTPVSLHHRIVAGGQRRRCVGGSESKRGRVQRRYLAQALESLWRHSPQPPPPPAAAAARGEAKPSWQPPPLENAAFEEYYKVQRIVREEEWDAFMSVLHKPLPATFRINASRQFFKDIRSKLESEFRRSLESQVPPLFLNVQPDQHILDMCAAPGSKTFQLLEMIHQSKEPGLLPGALVIANDVNVQRCDLLIRNTKRMCTANLIVTNHEAQNFPGCSLAKDYSEAFYHTSKPQRLEFDRVLCDVPCSGDGTIRKGHDMWRKWNSSMGNKLHHLQVDIAMRDPSEKWKLCRTS